MIMVGILIEMGFFDEGGSKLLGDPATYITLTFLCVLISAVCYLTVDPVRQGKRTNINIVNLGSKEKTKEFALEVDQSGLHLKGRLSSGSFGWKSVFKIDQNNRIIYVSPIKNDCLIKLADFPKFIPKRYFESEADQQTAYMLINGYIKEHSNPNINQQNPFTLNDEIASIALQAGELKYGLICMPFQEFILKVRRIAALLSTYIFLILAILFIIGLGYSFTEKSSAPHADDIVLIIGITTALLAMPGMTISTIQFMDRRNGVSNERIIVSFNDSEISLTNSTNSIAFDWESIKSIRKIKNAIVISDKPSRMFSLAKTAFYSEVEFEYFFNALRSRWKPDKYPLNEDEKPVMWPPAPIWK
jgi:hypothetical protein